MSRSSSSPTTTISPTTTTSPLPSAAEPRDDVDGFPLVEEVAPTEDEPEPMTSRAGERKIRILSISLVIIASGLINTLVTKHIDSMQSLGHAFNHAFLQTFCMMTGEFMSLVIYLVDHWIRVAKWQRNRQHGQALLEQRSAEPKLNLVNPLIFLPATLFDIVATCASFMGLILSTASTYQMLLSSVVVFTAIQSRIMLGTKLPMFAWFGIILVTVGLGLIGLADTYYNPAPSSRFSPLGNALIVLGTATDAVQMVYEQKFLRKYSVPPLLVVGLEGFWGIILMALFMWGLYFVSVPEPWSTNPSGRLEDVPFAIRQIEARPEIGVLLAITTISFGVSNWAGVSVTKRWSATTRVMVDSIRTLAVWVLSMALLGEHFVPFQLFGCVVMLIGVCLYSDVIITSYWRQYVQPKMEIYHPDLAVYFLKLCSPLDSSENGRGGRGEENVAEPVTVVVPTASGC